MTPISPTSHTKPLSGATHAAADRLPYSTPEAQGIPSRAIDTFVSALEKVDSIHSFMLLRHGHVVAEGWWEPYHPQDPHVLFSLSKSFTSTAIGLLAAEGRLTVDDPVLKFFPEDAPAKPSANLRAMQVRHLLSMNTGHETEPFVLFARTEGKTWVKRFLEHPVKRKPGTHFLYNSIATYMLSAIVTKLTGERLIDYLRPRLFEPLGIANPTWEQSPQGINTGGWGLSITTPDIAAFGQLYLQKGMWKGKRLISEAWVAQASAFQSDNGPANESDWTQGYGYQFWRCRHNAYRGDGAFGQYCVIMPDQEAVLAITGGIGDMQPPLTALWEHLLPAMSAAPLTTNESEQAALRNRLAALRLPTVQGAANSATAARVSGQVYKLGKNPDHLKSIRFAFDGVQPVVTFKGKQGEQRITVGCGAWVTNSAALPPIDGSMRRDPSLVGRSWSIAASGAWADDTTYVLKAWWYETPFACTFTCRFDGDRVTIEQRGNYGFDPTEGPTLVGMKG